MKNIHICSYLFWADTQVFLKTICTVSFLIFSKQWRKKEITEDITTRDCCFCNKDQYCGSVLAFNHVTNQKSEEPSSKNSQYRTSSRSSETKILVVSGCHATMEFQNHKGPPSSRQMNAQEAHSRKAARPRARPESGGARSSSANSPFQNQPCGWVPISGWTSTCDTTVKTYISTNTRWTRPGRCVKYFPLAENSEISHDN